MDLLQKNGDYIVFFWKRRDFWIKVDLLKLVIRLHFFIINNPNFMIHLLKRGTAPLSSFAKCREDFMVAHREIY